MIGIDTNILVRFLTKDDEKQYKLVLDLFNNLGENLIFVNSVVVIECFWVLEKIYDIPKDRLITIWEGLLQSKEIIFERRQELMESLQIYKHSSAGFEDCFISVINKYEKVEYTFSFDKKASKLDGMKLLR